MSRQKCMLVSKRSNLEVKKVIHFKLCHLRDKRSNNNLQSTKFRTQGFLDRVYASENQTNRKVQTEHKTHRDKNLKIDSIQVLQNLFCLKF